MKVRDFEAMKGIDYVTETNTYRAFYLFNTPIRKILCLVQCALHFACKLLKCFRAYTTSNDCFFSSCFSTLKIFPIGFKSELAKLLQSIRQQVAKIVETLHHLGALLIYLLSLTLQPPSPFYQCCLQDKKIVANLNSQH